MSAANSVKFVKLSHTNKVVRFVESKCYESGLPFSIKFIEETLVNKVM